MYASPYCLSQGLTGYVISGGTDDDDDEIRDKIQMSITLRPLNNTPANACIHLDYIVFL